MKLMIGGARNSCHAFRNNRLSFMPQFSCFLLFAVEERYRGSAESVFCLLQVSFG